MKKWLLIMLVIVMLALITACGSNTTSSSTSGPTTEQTTASPAEQVSVLEEDIAEPTETQSAPNDAASEQEAVVSDISGQVISVPALKGSIRIPDSYYVFGADYEMTDEMCRDIGVEPEKMQDTISLLQGQTMIVPADLPYNGENIYRIKVKGKKYDDITLSDLTQEDFDDLASTVVSSFGTSDYREVKGNGLRFFVFTANQGLGNVTRYATILNGHMVYVYLSTGDSVITDEQLATLEFIALSIQHGL